MPLHTTRGFLLCWLQNISSSTYRLSAAVPAFVSRMSFGICHQLSIFNQQQYRAEVTQNISTAESPGRYMQPGLSFRPKFFADSLSRFFRRSVHSHSFNPISTTAYCQRNLFSPANRITLERF